MKSYTTIDTAIILAAGYGKRLLPYTKHTPKPLLTVKDTPVLESIFHALKVANIKNVVVIIGHLKTLIKKYVTKNFGNIFNIYFVNQNPINGSAGGLEQAKNILMNLDRKFFLVTAGDYLLPNFYLRDLIEFHQNGSQDISLSLRKIDKEKVTESSIVEYDKNVIIRIHEKPIKIRLKKDPLASSLIYILPIKMVKYFPDVNFSKRGEKEVPSLINLMIADGMIAKGLQQESFVDWESKYKGT